MSESPVAAAETFIKAEDSKSPAKYDRFSHDRKKRGSPKAALNEQYLNIVQCMVFYMVVS